LVVVLLTFLLVPAAHASSPIETIGVYEGHDGKGDAYTSEPFCDTGGGCAVDDFETHFLNGRQVSHVLDFVNTLTATVPDTRIAAWNDIVNVKGQELVLSVGMFPANPVCSNRYYNDDTSEPTIPNGGDNCLAHGAAGDFDKYWQGLANTLVKGNLSHVIIRPGWEMNGGFFPWSASCRPTDYINYWRRIVNDMNGENGGVSGVPDFEYAWSPHLGNHPLPSYIVSEATYCQGSAQTDEFTPQDAYPGDLYVDYIGGDTYDNFVSNWDDVLNKQGFGLTQLANLATNKDKRLALPEWGLVSSTNYMPRDEFMDRIYGWIRGHDVSFANYFDRDVPFEGNYALYHFPNGRAAYTADFGKFGPTAGAPLDDNNPWGTTTRITATPTCAAGRVTGKVVANPPFSLDYNTFITWSLQKHSTITHQWVNWNDDGYYMTNDVGPTGGFSTPLSGAPWTEPSLAPGITDKPLANGAYRVRGEYSPNNNFSYKTSVSAWTKFYLTGSC
jgi:hypothetical protein